MNDLVASCSYDNTVNVWNSETGESIQKYTQHTNWVYSLDQIDADTLVTGSDDQPVHVWKISTGQNINKINASSFVYAVKFLSNAFIACGLYGTSGNFRIYNYLTGDLVKTLYGHTSWINSIETLNEEFMASGSADKKVIIWNLNSYSIKYNLTGHTRDVRCLKRISSSLLASGDLNGLIIIWNWLYGTLVQRLNGHTNWVVSLDLFDEETLISASFDKTIKFWNISSGELMQKINTNFEIGALAMLNKGKFRNHIFFYEIVLIKVSSK
jgi:WD40 repeat protein